MKTIKYISLLLSTTYLTCVNLYSTSIGNSENISNISKYEINIPASFDEHTLGFSSGIGSGLTLKNITENGNIEFYAITDRGPNYTIQGTDYAKHTIIFPKPNFCPFIGVITVVPNKSATLTHVLPLKINGQKINGLSIPKTSTTAYSSIPTDLSFQLLQPSLNGLDTESLDIDAEGNFWVGDEYHPALIKIQGSTGEILEILTPENALPKIIENGPSNRGFEALAITPNGKIYVSMESILDFQGNTQNSANFIRIIELDPITKQTRTLAYPYDKSSYKTPLAAKIGDLAAIDNSHLLIVEQGKTPNGMRNLIYIIDISKATDISHISLPNGCPLEYASLDELSNIRFIEKSLVFNANDHSWPHSKLEGLAIVNPRTIAITNDNDFGFSLSISGVDSEQVCGYSVDYTTQQLLKDKQPTHEKLNVHINQNAHTNIWLIEFKKNLLEFLAPAQ